MATRSRPHRGDLLLPVPGAATRRAHRTRDPNTCAPPTPPTSRSTPNYAPAKHHQPKRILTVFTDITRHELHSQGQLVQTFQPELTSLQQQILHLLAIPATAYAANRASGSGGPYRAPEVRNVGSSASCAGIRS